MPPSAASSRASARSSTPPEPHGPPSARVQHEAPSARTKAMWKGLLLAALAVGALALVPSLNASPSAKPGEIDWKSTLPSDDTGKRTLVYFTASWCPPCQAMKADSWPDDRVEKLLADRYDAVYVDIDADPATAQRFGVTAIPTVKVLDGGIEVASTHYLNADGLVDYLERYAE